MRTLSTRWGLLLCAAAAWLAAAPAPAATTFNIVPLDLGDGYRVSGTLTTDGTIGALAPANFTAWNIEVALTSVLARYTPSNTKAQFSGVTASGGSLTVAAAPDASTDGGSLLFRSPSVFIDLWAQPADFTSSSPSGGQASYAAGAAFDFLPLRQPDGSSYVAAKESAPGSSVFDLVPLAFGGGVTMSGTITTDGQLGDVFGIRDWDIVVTEVTRSVFNRGNSRVSELWGVLTDGQTITVSLPSDTEDGGVVGFRTGTRRLLELADFSSDALGNPMGQAVYVDRGLGVFQTAYPLLTDPGATRYAVAAGAEPGTAVPEPGTATLLAAGLALVGVRRRRAA